MATIPLMGGYIEAQEEVSYKSGIDPSGNCFWIGLAEEADMPAEKEYEEITYLGAEGDISMSSNYMQVPLGGKPIDISATYALQDFGLRKYAWGSETSFNDTIASLAFVGGIKIDDIMNYVQYKGGAVSKWDLTWPEFGIARGTMGATAGDIVAPTIVDPLTTGLHAVKNLDKPYVWTKIDKIYLDTNDPPTTEVPHFLGDVTLSFENTLDLPRSINATGWAKIGGARVLKRSIGISFGVHYVSLAWYNYVLNDTKVNVKLVVKGQEPEVTSTFLMKNFRMPRFDNRFKSGEYYGGTITLLADNPELTYSEA